jgi:hypothetical protein
MPPLTNVLTNVLNTDALNDELDTLRYNEHHKSLYNSLLRPIQNYINSLRIPKEISFNGSYLNVLVKGTERSYTPLSAIRTHTYKDKILQEKVIERYDIRAYGFKINLNDLSSGLCYAYNGYRYHVSKSSRWEPYYINTPTQLHFKFVKYKQSLPPILSCIKQSGSWKLYIPLERGPISLFSKNIANPYLVTSENKGKQNGHKDSFKHYSLTYTNYINTKNFIYTTTNKCNCNNHFVCSNTECIHKRNIINKQKEFVTITPWRVSYIRDCIKLVNVYKRLALARYLQCESVNTDKYETYYNKNIRIIRDFTTQLDICIKAYNSFKFSNVKFSNVKGFDINVNEIEIQFNDNIVKLRDIYNNIKPRIGPSRGIKRKIEEIEEIYNYIINELRLLEGINKYGMNKYKYIQLSAKNRIQLITSRDYHNKMIDYMRITEKYYNNLRILINDDKTYLQELTKINEINKNKLLSMGCLIPKTMGKPPINIFSVDEINKVFNKIKYDNNVLCVRVGDCMRDIYKTYEKQMFHRYIKEHYRLKKINTIYSNKLLKKVFIMWKKIPIYHDLSSIYHDLSKTIVKSKTKGRCVNCNSTIYISINYHGQFPKCYQCYRFG